MVVKMSEQKGIVYLITRLEVYSVYFEVVSGKQLFRYVKLAIYAIF